MNNLLLDYGLFIFFQTSHDINGVTLKALHISDVFDSKALLTKLPKMGLTKTKLIFPLMFSSYRKKKINQNLFCLDKMFYLLNLFIYLCID